MAKYIDVKDIPEGEKVYVKKDPAFLGGSWRVVHPINNEDGSTNWINLLVGGKRNALFLVMLLLIIGYSLWAYNKDISFVENKYKEISENPVKFCRDIKGGNITIIYPDLNLTNFIDAVEKSEG